MIDFGDDKNMAQGGKDYKGMFVKWSTKENNNDNNSNNNNNKLIYIT